MVRSTNIAPRRAVLMAGVLVVLCAALTLLMLVGEISSVDALKRAGLSANGGVIGGVNTLFDTLKNNVVWIAVTAIPTIIVVVGLLFLFGHSRAQDYAMRIALGILVIVAAPGIVA